ncbi:hypothetical protein B0H10DRAFT_1976535 [Mycena sp. CBHHK59/15]|nr:hypothetical protein B0H10DRAFT_1976535 [Mycena sp. CBHHK59/15]
MMKTVRLHLLVKAHDDVMAAISSSISTQSSVSRQSSILGFDPGQIPSECQSACNSVVDNANTCTTFQCLCTPKNDAAVLSCVDCVVSANGTGPVIVDGQDILNQFASECDINSVSVSSLSASGVATVSGVTTSNLNSPSPQTTSTMAISQASQSKSTTNPLSSSVAASPTRASAALAHQTTHFFLWPSYAAVTFFVVWSLF